MEGSAHLGADGLVGDEGRAAALGREEGDRRDNPVGAKRGARGERVESPESAKRSRRAHEHNKGGLWDRLCTGMGRAAMGKGQRWGRGGGGEGRRRTDGWRGRPISSPGTESKCIWCLKTRTWSHSGACSRERLCLGSGRRQRCATDGGGGGWRRRLAEEGAVGPVAVLPGVGPPLDIPGRLDRRDHCATKETVNPCPRSTPHNPIISLVPMYIPAAAVRQTCCSIRSRPLAGCEQLLASGGGKALRPTAQGTPSWGRLPSWGGCLGRHGESLGSGSGRQRGRRAWRGGRGGGLRARGAGPGRGRNVRQVVLEGEEPGARAVVRVVLRPPAPKR